MTMSAYFDTLSSVRRMRERGIPQDQAEVFAEEIRMASQVDFSHLATRAETKADLRELELRLKLHIGGMLFALGGLLVAIKYFG